jgi:dTDP-4-dehydrorhamnose reductase
MRLAVFGAFGQLGAVVVDACRGRHEVAAFGHERVDITSDAAVRAAVAAARPDAVVNCAAYNLVDAAEDHPVDAMNVNALAVRALAQAATACGAAFVHYSTDFVFDGTATAPYTEDDQPNPRSVYAVSKLLGEWFAADATPAYVLRVESLFGSAPGGRAKGSLDKIMKSLLAGEPARVFEDRTVTPSYVVDIAEATLTLLERRAAPGVYHCVNAGAATWLELSVELARLLGVAPNVVPVKQADVRLRAERPQYCALSNAKLAAAGAVMPSWQDAFARYVAAVRSPS